MTDFLKVSQIAVGVLSSYTPAPGPVQVSGLAMPVLSAYQAPAPPTSLLVKRSALVVLSSSTPPPEDSPPLQVSQIALAVLSPYASPVTSGGGSPVKATQLSLAVLSEYIDPSPPDGSSQDAIVIIPIDVAPITFGAPQATAQSKTNPDTPAVGQAFPHTIVVTGFQLTGNGHTIQPYTRSITFSPPQAFASGSGFQYQTPIPRVNVYAPQASARDGRGTVFAGIGTVNVSPPGLKAANLPFQSIFIGSVAGSARSEVHISGDIGAVSVENPESFAQQGVYGEGPLGSVAVTAPDGEGSAGFTFDTHGSQIWPTIHVSPPQAVVVRGSDVRVPMPGPIIVRPLSGGMSPPRSAQILAPIGTIFVTFSGKSSTGEYFYSVPREFSPLVVSAPKGFAQSLSNTRLYMVIREIRSGIIDGIMGILISLDIDDFSTDEQVKEAAYQALHVVKDDIQHHYLTTVIPLGSSDNGVLSEPFSSMIIKETRY